MADNPAADLGASFRELVTTWEREFNAFANQVMGTETFSRTMNQAQKSQLGLQQMFSDHMGRQLMALNLPTRGDIVNMAETLQDVVRRLERIEARLEHNQIGQQAQDTNPLPKPPRTRRPPDAYLQEETTN